MYQLFEFLSKSNQNILSLLILILACVLFYTHYSPSDTLQHLILLIIPQLTLVSEPDNLMHILSLLLARSTEINRVMNVFARNYKNTYEYMRTDKNILFSYECTSIINRPFVKY